MTFFFKIFYYFSPLSHQLIYIATNLKHEKVKSSKKVRIKDKRRKKRNKKIRNQSKNEEEEPFIQLFGR